MNCEYNYKEKVAAGLRNMNNPPDYFIFLEMLSENWEGKSICGIPVLFCPGFVNFHKDIESSSPFIPAWKNAGIDSCEAINFEIGYINY